MLTFKQIEALYWVVELGGFAKAADKLNTTQSAITKRIKELEADFDIQVFDRSSKKAMITQKGREIFEMADSLLSLRDVMLIRLKGHHTFSGTLRLGITEITAMTWLPDLMRELKIFFPQLKVTPIIGMAAELHKNLLEARLDMAFLHGDLRGPLLEAEPLGVLKFAWMGSPELISSDKIYTPEEISKMFLIRQDQESGLNGIYDEWLKPYSAEQNLFTINSLLAMAGLTVAGFGVSCLPVDYFYSLVQQRKLIVAQTTKPTPQSQYCSMYLKNMNSALYQEIAELARQCCNFAVPYGTAVGA